MLYIVNCVKCSGRGNYGLFDGLSLACFLGRSTGFIGQFLHLGMFCGNFGSLRSPTIDYFWSAYTLVWVKSRKFCGLLPWMLFTTHYLVIRCYHSLIALQTYTHDLLLMPVRRESPFVATVCMVFNVIICIFDRHITQSLHFLIRIIYYLSHICQVFVIHLSISCLIVNNL